MPQRSSPSSHYMSPYAASKFAIEGWCDSVRRELKPQGVDVVCVEPAGVATPIWNKALRQDDSFVSPKYRRAIGAFREKFIMKGNEGMDPAVAARKIYRRITSRRPPTRCIIAKNRFLSRCETLIPDRILDAVTARMFPL